MTYVRLNTISCNKLGYNRELKGTQGNKYDNDKDGRAAGMANFSKFVFNPQSRTPCEI